MRQTPNSLNTDPRFQSTIESKATATHSTIMGLLSRSKKR